MNTIQNILAQRPAAIELWGFLVNLALVAVAGAVVSWAYVKWGCSLSNRRRFAGNLVLVSLITALIITVIKSSLALSLGLVGALSIVRFRAAIKEPEELAFLFLAVALGVAFGADQRVIGLVGLAVILTVLAVRRLVRTRADGSNLHLTVSTPTRQGLELHSVIEAVRPHCRKLELVRYDETKTSMEVSLIAEFTTSSDLQRAGEALRALSDGLQITYIDSSRFG